MGRRVVRGLRLRREARGATLEQEGRQDRAARAGRRHGSAGSAVGDNGTLLAAASTDGRLLVFKVAELPELPRGKGNKILAVAEQGRRHAGGGLRARQGTVAAHRFR